MYHIIFINERGDRVDDWYDYRTAVRLVNRLKRSKRCRLVFSNLRVW